MFSEKSAGMFILMYKPRIQSVDKYRNPRAHARRALISHDLYYLWTSLTVIASYDSIDVE